MSVFHSDVTKSQHVDAESDQHFEDTTFKLKRTRSHGLLDEYIPDKKESDHQQQQQQQSYSEVIDDDDLPEVTNDTETNSESIASPVYNLQSPELLPHDDTDLTAEPSRHVDYLSHQWDVSDIWKSWRYVISRKKNVANAARLENASWRTWAQRRSNLKTVSPEIVNWSKDCDVTWLYGPIMNDDSKHLSNNQNNNENDDHDDLSTAISAVAGDISIPKKKYHSSNPKPILKKRTIEESIISHSNLLKLQLATQTYNKKKESQEQQQNISKEDEYFDVNALSDKLNHQYRNNNTVNNDNVEKIRSLINNDNNEGSNSNLPDTSIVSSPSVVNKKDRHIHFNDEVQQCMAVDEYSDEYEDDYSDYEDNVNYLDQSHYEDENDAEFKENIDDDDDEDDDEGFFLNIKSNNQQPAIGKSTSESSISSSLSRSKSYTSIQLIPSTTLNYGSDEDSSDEENPYTSSLSHNVNNDISRGYDYYYDYNTVYTCDPQYNNIVDVPENLEVGSNFDYETDSPIIQNSPNSQPVSPSQTVGSPNQTIGSPNTSKSPFQLSESEEDSDNSDSDDGLSIGTRRSSQHLAESIFHNGLKPHERSEKIDEKEESQPQQPHQNTNTNSNSKLAKQPSSSNSLSQSFFNNSSFSTDQELSKSFLNTDSSNKSSPLPPHTTSENAQKSRDNESISNSSSDSDDGLVLRGKSYSTLNDVLKSGGRQSPSSENPESQNQIMGQAKGLAKHFFG